MQDEKEAQEHNSARIPCLSETQNTAKLAMHNVQSHYFYLVSILESLTSSPSTTNIYHDIKGFYIMDTMWNNLRLAE